MSVKKMADATVTLTATVTNPGASAATAPGASAATIPDASASGTSRSSRNLQFRLPQLFFAGLRNIHTFTLCR